MPDEQGQDVETHLGVRTIDGLDEWNAHRHCLVMASKEAHDYELGLSSKYFLESDPGETHENKK